MELQSQGDRRERPQSPVRGVPYDSTNPAVGEGNGVSSELRLSSLQNLRA